MKIPSSNNALPADFLSFSSHVFASQSSANSAHYVRPSIVTHLSQRSAHRRGSIRLESSRRADGPQAAVIVYFKLDSAQRRTAEDPLDGGRPTREQSGSNVG
jgi:hypothetical protein